MVFNLTGGPRTMIVAATMGCLLLGIAVVYVPEEEPSPAPVDLPILGIRHVRTLTPRSWQGNWVQPTPAWTTAF